MLKKTRLGELFELPNTSNLHGPALASEIMFGLF